MSLHARLRPKLSSASVIFHNAQPTQPGRLKEISDKLAAVLRDRVREISDKRVAMPSGLAKAIPHNAPREGRLARETLNRQAVATASETGVSARQVAGTAAELRSEE
jgi:hypothetical protein